VNSFFSPTYSEEASRRTALRKWS